MTVNMTIEDLDLIEFKFREWYEKLLLHVAQQGETSARFDPSFHRTRLTVPQYVEIVADYKKKNPPPTWRTIL